MSLPYLPGFRDLPCCNMTKLCIPAHVHKKILLPVIPGFGIDVAMPYQINVSHC